DEVKRALVAIGGDLAIGDAPPGKKGWRVGVEPLPTGFTRVLLLKNVAASTAGDREQFVEIAGVRYSHIIDPRTKMGLTERIAVTVIAKEGIIDDGLDTALSVMGPA